MIARLVVTVLALVVAGAALRGVGFSLELPRSPGPYIGAVIVIAFALELFVGSHAGTRFAVLAACTVPFAVAALWDVEPRRRAILVLIGVVAVWVARGIGVIIWPDVAVVCVASLAAIAVWQVVHAEPEPDPPPGAVAVLDLPTARVADPPNMLRAPAAVEVIAITPVAAAGQAAATHETKRFDALLLTPVPATGATRPVRLVVDRGEHGITIAELARNRIDATQFVLVPAGDCFVAPSRLKLRPRQAKTILRGLGFPDERSAGFVDSFAGLVDYVPVLPRRTFFRYSSGATKVGSFLTSTNFDDSELAQDALALPEGNDASREQTVRVAAPTMALRGRIRGGDEDVLQFVVLRTECFDFGNHRKVDASMR